MPITFILAEIENRGLTANGAHRLRREAPNTFGAQNSGFLPVFGGLWQTFH